MTIVDPAPQGTDRNATGQAIDTNASVPVKGLRSCGRGFFPLIGVSSIPTGAWVGGCDWAGSANR
jgi:hypothetical protein